MTITLLWTALLVATASAVVLGMKFRAVSLRFAPVLSIEEEAERVRAETERQKRAVLAELEESREKTAREMRELQEKNSALRSAYKQAKETYEQLQSEVALLQEGSEEMSYGLYAPHYALADSELYRRRRDEVYQQKKVCIKGEKAFTYPRGWTVNNNLAEGKRMIRKQVKIMLRAFNGECDSSIAQLTWNNASRMEARIRRSYEAINDLGTVVTVGLSDEYLQLCLAELWLTHEFELKKQEEKDKAREAREQMKQEERAQRDFERAKRDAVAEQAKAEKALQAARKALEKATGSHLDAICAEIQALEAKMAAAQAKQERAVSMAQLTKMGHVYVISNIGSFGSEVFKIGMTRRLEPDDRIQELGGASVPFGFDVHAMIFSNDAPGLEAALHFKFADRRLNLVNGRKEYFRVSLAEIEAFARERDQGVAFISLAEAKQFRQSEALRQRALAQETVPAFQASGFPEELLPEEMGELQSGA